MNLRKSLLILTSVACMLVSSTGQASLSNTVTFTWESPFGGGPFVNYPMELTPKAVGTNGPANTTIDPNKALITDSNGTIVITNMVFGGYSGIFKGPQVKTPFAFVVPITNGNYLLKDLLTNTSPALSGMFLQYPPVGTSNGYGVMSTNGGLSYFWGLLSSGGSSVTFTNASNTAKGVVQGDGTTITIVNGIATAVASGAASNVFGTNGIIVTPSAGNATATLDQSFVASDSQAGLMSSAQYGTLTNRVGPNEGRALNFGNAANIFVGRVFGNATNQTGTAALTNLSNGNGSALTSLTGANVTGTVPLATSATTVTGSLGGSVALPLAQATGSLADARLSANVALLNAAQNWSAVQTYVNSGVTFGPDNGSSILQFMDHQRLQWGDVTNANKASVFLNSSHGGGGDNSELQFDCNFFSFGPKEHGQFGLIANTKPTSFYVTRWQDATASKLLSQSYIWGYQFAYYSNGNFYVGYINSFATPYATNGNTRLTWYANPTDTQGPDASATNGAPMVDMFSGRDFYGLGVHGATMFDLTTTAITPAGSFSINMGQSEQAVQGVTSMTLAITNFTLLATTNVLKANVDIFPGLSDLAITWSPAASVNLRWESESGLAIAPTLAPASKILHLAVKAMIFGGTTNCIIHTSLTPYTVTIDAASQSFFTAAATLSAAETNAINTFVLNAKGHSYWNNLIDFHPFVGGTATTCSYNLVNTSKYQITWHGTSATNFTALGIYGDGSSVYGDLAGLVPATEITSPNSSMAGAWVRGPANPTNSVSASTGEFFGVVGANGDRWGTANIGSSSFFFTTQGMNATTTAGLTFASAQNFVGFIGQNTQSVSVEKRYLNGVNIGGTSTTVAALPTTRDVYVLARDSGSADQFINANLTGFVVAQNMTDQNVSDLITDWTLLNNSLGR